MQYTNSTYFLLIKDMIHEEFQCLTVHQINANYSKPRQLLFQLEQSYLAKEMRCNHRFEHQSTNKLKINYYILYRYLYSIDKIRNANSSRTCAQMRRIAT